MTHPGTPSVFYDHLEEPQLAHTMQRLIALRLRAGIHCRSQVKCPLTPAKQAGTRRYCCIFLQPLCRSAAMAWL